jgi:hypothetical protein
LLDFPASDRENPVITAWASSDARRIRAAVFDTFAREGRPPSPHELVATLQLDDEQVLAGLRELHDAHAVVLTEAGDPIRMAHPFSAWPMGFVVRRRDRFWWGGCAWDSFGIMAALGTPLEILTSCPGCGRELRYEAAPDRPPADHRLVARLPHAAAHWWDDVVATCTQIRTFCSLEHVETWREQTGAAQGATVQLAQLHQLALPWYGDRLDREWSPRSREHRQRLLEESGLTGPFWRLP